VLECTLRWRAIKSSKGLKVADLTQTEWSLESGFPTSRGKPPIPKLFQKGRVLSSYTHPQKMARKTDTQRLPISFTGRLKIFMQEKTEETPKLPVPSKVEGILCGRLFRTYSAYLQLHLPLSTSTFTCKVWKANFRWLFSVDWISPNLFGTKCPKFHQVS